MKTQQVSMAREFQVALGAGRPTTARLYTAAPEQSLDAVLVLAHGAGAGQQHPFMTGCARDLAAHGIDVVTFNFAYAEQRRRTPDTAAALEDCFRRAIEIMRAAEGLGSRRLFVGGKSMGGRIATHLAAEAYPGLQGVVVLGYPLHPPGKPERARTAHLPAIRVPMLIVQGERDAFGTPAELAPVVATLQAPVTIHVVHGGDHSLSVRGQTRDQVFAPVIAAIRDWMR